MKEIKIPSTLYTNVVEYSKLNQILDVDEFIIKLINVGFTIEKYGVEPKMNKRKDENLNEKKISTEKKDMYGEN
jgi:hypothetical protein